MSSVSFVSSKEFEKMKNCQINVEIVLDKRKLKIVIRAHQNSEKLNRFMIIFTNLKMITDDFKTSSK